VIGPTALLALAAVIIAVALQASHGTYGLVALALVTLGTAAAVVGALWRKRGSPADRPVIAQAILGAGCVAGLGCHLFVSPIIYGDVAALRGGFRGFAMIALVLLAAYLCVHLRASLVRARFLLLLACFAVMGVAVLRASPQPWIDVWNLEQEAASRFLHGENPYTASYSDLYGPGETGSYPRQFVRDGRLEVFPYPPLTLLLEAPGYALFGDVRYALLALMLGAAWLVARAAPGTLGELAALLILFQPRTFFVLEQGWSDPLVLFCFALTVSAIARAEHWGWSGAALGLLAASKQYSPFLAVPLAFAMPRRRGLLVAGAVLLALVVPFALEDPGRFWRGVVSFHFGMHFRWDSLSLTVLAAHLFGGRVQSLAFAGTVLAAGVLALCVRRNLALPVACAAAAAAWAAVLIWNKQSFCNYWWLCSGVLAAAAAAPAARERG
jgi:hypothetical protein